MRAVSYLEMLFFFLKKKSILGSTDTWVPVNSFKEKVGGRHSDQGFFDNVNLLTLNPDSVDGMKDFVETQMRPRAGDTGQMLATTETRASWMGFVWPIMETRHWREGAVGDPENQDTKNTLWPLCFHWSLDLGKARCLENY